VDFSTFNLAAAGQDRILRKKKIEVNNITHMASHPPGQWDYFFIEDEVHAIFTYITVYTVLFTTTAYALCHDGPTFIKVTHNLLSIPKCLLTFYLALRTVLELNNSLEDRWFGQSAYGHEYYRWYIATNFVDVFIELAIARQENISIVTILPMMFHHAASVGGYSMGLYVRRWLDYWAAACGLCEITNLPLAGVYLGKLCKGSSIQAWINKNHAWLPNASGVLLWILWFPFRLFLFPSIMYYILAEGIEHGVWSSGAVDVDVRWHELAYRPIEVGMYLMVVLLLLVLSLLWFIGIHKGLIKTFRTSGILSPVAKQEPRKVSATKQQQQKKKN
tara:strand:+ start:113 stop:1108 length:996 start_codon:yes stop_codon:yes gene_type:complete